VERSLVGTGDPAALRSTHRPHRRPRPSG